MSATYLVQVLDVPQLTALTYWGSHQQAVSDVLKPSYKLEEVVLNVKPTRAYLGKDFAALKKLILTSLQQPYREADLQHLHQLDNLRSLSIDGYAPTENAMLSAFTVLHR